MMQLQYDYGKQLPKHRVTSQEMLGKAYKPNQTVITNVDGASECAVRRRGEGTLRAVRIVIINIVIVICSPSAPL
ncbi:unnamed protein product [Toxocara canis]|nr:unnamed protein product [Toxocara canis]